MLGGEDEEELRAGKRGEKEGGIARTKQNAAKESPENQASGKKTRKKKEQGKAAADRGVHKRGRTLRRRKRFNEGQLVGPCSKAKKNSSH